MGELKNMDCLLKKLNSCLPVKLDRGSEIEFVTKNGQKFKAILCDFVDGRLHTVLSLGIILSVPISALTKLYLV